MATDLDDPTLRDIRLKKPRPLVVERGMKRLKREQHRVDIKAQVFKRDAGLCRCCGGHATEMHELVPRGAGGKRSLYNSIAVCGYAGANCHRLLQRYVIKWLFTNDDNGAEGLIEFHANGRTWQR